MRRERFTPTREVRGHRDKGQPVVHPVNSTTTIALNMRSASPPRSTPVANGLVSLRWSTTDSSGCRCEEGKAWSVPFHHAHRRDDAKMQHAFAPGTRKNPVKIGYKRLLQKFNSSSEMLPGRHLSAASAPRCLNNLNETLFQRSLSCSKSAPLEKEWKGERESG